MISFIVGNMHVSTTSREIIAEFRRRMKVKCNSSKLTRRWRPEYMDRNVRKNVYHLAIEVHKANVATYMAVMRGM